ncbi:hypothetical protein SO802_020870 [Lithocarpus litseifolius]|uniref:RNA polymerase II C-terminal domain phosphatase-like n=1 Tax=Lithocarpus litseifolius TaxID=425828 RepID=A0AAW2CH92_9ROSI
MVYPQDSSGLYSSSLSIMGVHDDTHKVNLKAYGVTCMDCVNEAFMFKYIDKNLWVSPDDEISQLQMIEESEKLLNNRKIVLVLDLDKTLLHTTKRSKYLKTPEELLQHKFKDSLFRVQPWAMMTKLRPFVHTFLKEASTMFELHICTMGKRDYASKMVEFLDPEKVYFKSRVITREDLVDSEEKSLDLVLRHKRMAIILDDNQHVWKHDQSNLILVKKYFYFNSKSANSIASFSALNTDEDETTGVLATILEKLKTNPRTVFQPKIQGVLQGCKLTFKGIFPPSLKPENSCLWSMAEELGAICSMDDALTPFTHVVTWAATAEESQQAELDKNILVHPRWLHDCYDACKRYPGKDFRVELKN